MTTHDTEISNAKARRRKAKAQAKRDLFRAALPGAQIAHALGVVSYVLRTNAPFMQSREPDLSYQAQRLNRALREAIRLADRYAQHPDMMAQCVRECQAADRILGRLILVNELLMARPISPATVGLPDSVPISTGHGPKFMPTSSRSQRWASAFNRKR